MSVSSLGASSNASSYLQSLLQQQRTSTKDKDSGRSADPLTMLLNAIYPAANSSQGADSSQAAGSANSSQQSQTSSAATSPSGNCGGSSISPDTMTNLLAVQAQGGAQGAGNDVASRAHALFGQFDANSDGQIGKSEFENAFGSGADMSKVDGLFNALDTNQDGSVGEDELTSAAQESAARRHHHAHGAGSGQGSGLLDMLKSGADGSTSETSSNADGSTTTTISYTDGSKVTMTSPAASTAGATSQDQVRRNVLEQLIQLQAQWSTSATSNTTSV